MCIGSDAANDYKSYNYQTTAMLTSLKQVTVTDRCYIIYHYNIIEEQLLIKSQIFRGSPQIQEICLKLYCTKSSEE